MVLPFTLWSRGEEEVRGGGWSWNGWVLCTIMVVQFVRSHAQRVVVYVLCSVCVCAVCVFVVFVYLCSMPTCTLPALTNVLRGAQVHPMVARHASM